MLSFRPRLACRMMSCQTIKNLHMRIKYMDTYLLQIKEPIVQDMDFGTIGSYLFKESA